VFKGRHLYRALWLGHEFFTLALDDLGEIPVEELAQTVVGERNDGLLHYKYVPRTGHPGESDAACVTLTPSTGSKAVIDRAWRGKGVHAFRTSSWEQLPTMFHVVNALADLPVIERRGALLTQSHGGKDLRDQRELE
jgi:hypothetical protein